MSRFEEEKEKKELEEKETEMMEEYGQMSLENNKKRHKIHLLSIIGEVEGHENLSGSSKATKYDHVLPKLAEIERRQRSGRAAGSFEYFRRGRRCRTCHCRDDCIFKYSYCISGIGRQPFHRSAL